MKRPQEPDGTGMGQAPGEHKNGKWMFNASPNSTTLPGVESENDEIDINTVVVVFVAVVD